MKLDRTREVLVFDTSGLLDMAASRSSTHGQLVNALPQTGQCVYHPLSLSEIAEWVHVAVWQERRPQMDAHRGAASRRQLLQLLFHQRKSDSPSHALHGFRFLPFLYTNFAYLSLVAHQRQVQANLRTLLNRRTPVAHLTDHQILAAACWLQRAGFRVRFVGSDHALLGAAAHLGVRWLYSKDPGITSAFAF